MLSEYNKKSIRWLLQEKYGYSDLDINQFFNSSDLQNVQGWVLAKTYKGSRISTEALKDINRVLQGEPVDYVIGFKHFLDCKIDLSLKPLIPRVETEYWVKKAIGKTLKQYNNKKVNTLDIFCGSGCIGVSLLKNIPNSFVTFADVSNECLEQTNINLQINNFQSSKNGERYILVKSDIFKSIKGKFNVIFANPPYVPNHFVKLSKELFYEPSLALAGGQEGLDIVEKFLIQLPIYLTKNGTCYMEFGDNQKNQIKDILEKLGYKDYKFKIDQFGVERYLSINL